MVKFNFKCRIRQLLISFALLISGSPSALAQDNGWILGIHSLSNSVITNDVLVLLVDMPINGLIGNMTDGMVTGEVGVYNFHYLSMKDNGEKVDFKRSNPYGFTSYDLFNDFEIGIKAGWQGPESPIGAYLYGAYGINQYRLRFLGEQEYRKHKLQSFRTGIRVRISPLQYLMDDYEWCPIIELGTTYVKNFKYKGGYDNDIDQINDGLRSHYAIGVNTLIGDSEWQFMLSFDMAHYDIFNKNYTPDGGFWYPYANFKNKDYTIGFSASVRLGDY